MAYELADGSLSSDYEIGDTFVVNYDHFMFRFGERVAFQKDDGTRCPCFRCQERSGIPVHWHRLNPTQETKRKVHARKKEKEMKPFTKDDLQNEDVVALRNGYVRELYKNTLLGKCRAGRYVYGNDFQFFDPDLTHQRSNDLDIMKVIRNGTVLFEREEQPHELTIEEIAAKFNLPLERVRIKK